MLRIVGHLVVAGEVVDRDSQLGLGVMSGTRRPR
jgi:hypothetical protein